jgi:uncharacterized Zn-finger protein
LIHLAAIYKPNAASMLEAESPPQDPPKEQSLSVGQACSSNMDLARWQPWCGNPGCNVPLPHFPEDWCGDGRVGWKGFKRHRCSWQLGLELPYSCDHPGCNKSFTLQSSLDRHKLGHEVEPLHICQHPGCNKSFKRLDVFNSHKLVHTGAKPHACKHPGCGQTFTHLSSLKSHLLSHRGGRLHFCFHPGCGRCFRVRSHLIDHRQTHAAKKTVDCNVCGKSFSRKQELRRHELTHTGTKPHQCDRCDMSFALLQGLKRHQLVHSGEKAHHCNHLGCTQTFRHEWDLHAHTLMHEEETKLQWDMQRQWRTASSVGGSSS